MIHVASPAASPTSMRTVPLVAVERTRPVATTTSTSAGRWMSDAVTTTEPSVTMTATDSTRRRPDTSRRTELAVGDADQLQPGGVAPERFDDAAATNRVGGRHAAGQHVDVAERRLAVLALGVERGAGGGAEDVALLDGGELGGDRLQRSGDLGRQGCHVVAIGIGVGGRVRAPDGDRVAHDDERPAARLDVALERQADGHDHQVGSRRRRRRGRCAPHRSERDRGWLGLRWSLRGRWRPSRRGRAHGGRPRTPTGCRRCDRHRLARCTGRTPARPSSGRATTTFHSDALAMNRGSVRSTAVMTIGSTKPLPWLATITTGRSPRNLSRPTTSTERWNARASTNAMSPITRSVALRNSRGA